MKVFLLCKTFVKQHTRQLSSGKVVTVQSHHDKRSAAKKDVPAVAVPANAVPTKKSFVVKKVGKKWLTVTYPGKTFQMQLAIAPETAHYTVGSTIENLPVGEVKESSGYGVKVMYYPLSGDEAKNADDQSKRKKIEQWLGWVEEKAKQGWRYNKGFDTLAELGAHDFPEYKERIEAAKKKALEVGQKANIAKWKGYVADSAKKGYVYQKGVDELKKMGVPQDEINQLLEPIAAIKEKKNADKKAQEESEAASGVLKHYFWSSGKSGSNMPSVGQTIKVAGEYRTVTFVSKGMYVSDASSFGGSDDKPWQFMVKTRPATAEYSDKLKAQEKVAALKADGKKKIADIGSRISHEGEKPEGSHTPVGDVVHDTFNIYGGGEKLVIDKDGGKIWYIRNNGTDGGDWSANNIKTGGAGAVGWHVPYSHEMEQKIRAAIANSNGQEYQPQPAPANEQPNEQPASTAASKQLSPWSDEEWEKHHIPKENQNYRTHKKQLDEMRKLAESGDIDGLKNMTFGTNTYARRRAKTHAELLTAMGEKPLTKCYLIVSVQQTCRAP